MREESLEETPRTTLDTLRGWALHVEGYYIDKPLCAILGVVPSPRMAVAYLYRSAWMCHVGWNRGCYVGHFWNLARFSTDAARLAGAGLSQGESQTSGRFLLSISIFATSRLHTAACRTLL